MKKTKIIIVIIFSLSLSIFGQEKSINRGNQQWMQYYNQTKLSEVWTLLTDGGLRWKEELSSRSQYIVRLGVGYQFNDSIRVVAGVAHLGLYQSDQLSRVEFRPYQEFVIKQKYGKIGISHRFRVEERYFRKVLDGKITNKDNFNFRFRYHFSLSIPLFKMSHSHPEMKVFLDIADEIFINAGKEVVYNVFDQNRILIGPAIQLNKNLTVKFTYNSQFAAANSPANYEYADVIWLGITHKLDLTNKEQEY